jgi:exodeoxyribonuclease VII small subunit
MLAMMAIGGSEIERLSFEEALAALEQVVRRLESGEEPLDESIALYERGEALRKHCQARLDAAQMRIRQIVTDSEGRAIATRSFDEDS